MVNQSTHVLQTVGLKRTYTVGRSIITALGGIDLTVQRGEKVAIMGPSGCGKSTLLNLLGGLDQPTAGQVMIDGVVLTSQSEAQRTRLRRVTLGFIFQRHDLFSMLTARENVEFPLLLADVDAPARQQRTTELLTMVGLADKADYLPDELSGGQQQRVGIARAFVNAPSIIFADEPTGNLDSATATEILDALFAVVEAQQVTLLMVTHDPVVADRANRTVFLKDGRIVSQSGESL